MAEITKYKIKGTHCDACVMLIKLELEEAGFPKFKITNEGDIDIPNEYLARIDEIKEAISNAGDYELVSE